MYNALEEPLRMRPQKFGQTIFRCACQFTALVSTRAGFAAWDAIIRWMFATLCRGKVFTLLVVALTECRDVLHRNHKGS